MSYTIDNPINYFPQFSKFGAVGGGELYIGVVDGDPAFTPADRIQAYIARQNDTDLAIPQPIDLSPGGVPMYNGSAVTLKGTGVEFSMQVLDSQGNQIYYSPRSGEITAAILALQSSITNLNFIKPVETFADLATTPETTLGMVVYVKQHTSGSLGGGFFRGELGTIVNDGGTIINNAVTAGRHWKRIDIDFITPEMFGCVSTSTAIEATRAINKAVVYGAANGLPVRFEQINYPLDGNIDGTVDGATIPGQGRGGIQVKTNAHIIFSGQVFTQVASPYTAYSLVNFSGAENFIVEGPAEFIGDMLIHGPTGGEFGHGLYICNAHSGRISDLYVRNCWGDGAYVSDTDFTSLASGTATASKNITITNCVFDNNRRQGMSGINGQHITWNNCKFINTGQTLATAPSAGIDLETDASPNRIGMQHWEFNNCLMDGNVGPSVLIFPTLNNGLPGCFDIAFNDCTMTNTEAQGSFWSDRAYPYVDNIRVNGGYIGGGVYSGNATTFNGVTIERNMLDVGSAAYTIEFIATSFGANFNDCKIIAGGDTTVNSKKLLFLPVGPTDEKKPTFNKCRFVAEDTYGGATTTLLVTRSPITFTECEFTTEGTAPASYVGFDTTAGNSRVGLPIYAMLYDCWISTTWHIGYTTLQGRVNFLSTKIRSIAATGTNAVPISTGADIFEFVYAAGGASTISAPTDPYQKLITITIKCTGGVMGATTWNATYKMAAWTNPATGFSRSITFRYDGTNWIEVSRTPADVPN